MADLNAEILQRLARMEATQGAQVDAAKQMATEQIKHGKQLERIATRMEGMPPRLDSHSRRLGVIERVQAPMVNLMPRVVAIEATMGKRGFLAAVIGAVATAMVLAGKWLIFSNQSGR